MTVWENVRTIEQLRAFRELTVKYFNGLAPRGYSILSEQEESEASHAARTEINRVLLIVEEMIDQSGVSSVIHWSPPPAVGGFQQRIHLIRNIFNLSPFQISPQKVIDAIEQAIGVYEADHPAALRRTYNPFFWIGRVLSKFSSIPFSILEHAGLYGRKLEDSLVGRILKLITEAAAALTAAYGFLKLIGHEEWLLRLFK